MSSSVLNRHNVTVLGEGKRVIVLAHGFGCDQRVWRFVAPQLAKDHRVVLFDHAGCGQSDLSAWHPARYSGLEDYARDVVELIDAISSEPVVYVGHSISSSIGMLAAIAAPDRFDRLIMLAPNPCFINDPPDYVGGFERADVLDLLDLMDQNMAGWANFFAPVAMRNADRPELADELQHSLCAGDPAIVRHFARLVFLSDVRPYLGHLQVPVLIAQCDDDAVAPSSVGSYLQQHIPHATLRHMVATGHCPHMSYPDETVAVIRDYLGQSLR
ncbi:MAG: alpha/beta fold hydrolase [Acidobacteriota bacterium]